MRGGSERLGQPCLLAAQVAMSWVAPIGACGDPSCEGHGLCTIATSLLGASMTSKKMSRGAPRGLTAGTTRSASSRQDMYVRPKNDNLSAALDAAGLIDPKYAGTDRFLDIVTWNIRFFHDRDDKRVNRVVEVLAALNADIFVFQEILDRSMDVVAQKLGQRGAGYYSVSYGSTGGQQRIALMHDLDWTRLKEEPRELYGRGEVVTSDGKDAFPRQPYLGVFTCLRKAETGALVGEEGAFDFQLLGVHLKSQRGGGDEQRELEGKKLAEWLAKEAPKTDADVVVLGDWNASPDAAPWAPLRKLEEQGRAAFTKYNNSSDISHLMFRNASEFGSRIDLACVSGAATEKVAAPPQVVRWTSLEDLLSGQPKAKQIREYIKEIAEDVSDHMPVVTRFYFEERNAATSRKEG